MKTKKGFISTSIIYSFFLVFILIMIAILMSYINKRFLLNKQITNINQIVPDIIPETEGTPLTIACNNADTLSDCLFKAEYIEYKNIQDKAAAGEALTDADEEFRTANGDFLDIYNSGEVTIEKIKGAIKNKNDNRTGDGSSFYTDTRVPQTTEIGLYCSFEDGDKETYYYRGAEDDNFVLFNDMLWSIVRINGDGTIRLVYQGEWDKVQAADDKKKYIKESGYIDVNNDGVLDENDSRHFNATKSGDWKTGGYELAYDIYSNVDEGCVKYADDIDSLIVSGFCSWADDKKEEKLRKILNHGIADEYKGATSIWNAGFMNYGKAEGDENEKLKNNSDSDALMFLKKWFNAKFQGTSNINYVSQETDICANKSVSTTENKGALITTYTYDDGLYYTNGDGEGGCFFSEGENYCEASYSNNNSMDYFTKYSSDLINNVITDNHFYCSSYNNSKIDIPHDNLDYSISLLSARELYYAGAPFRKTNNDFYLATDFPYWTTDLAFGNQTGSLAEYDTYYFLWQGNYLSVRDDEEEGNVAYIKPVINIDISEENYKCGNGSIDTPYLIGSSSISCKELENE